MKIKWGMVHVHFFCFFVFYPPHVSQAKRETRTRRLSCGLGGGGGWMQRVGEAGGLRV